MSSRQPVAQLSMLRNNRPRVVEVDGERIVLVRQGDDVRAISNTCPHSAGDLGLGDVRNGFIQCPVHLAWFNLVTGRSELNANSVALTYEVEIDGDDVFVLGPATPSVS
jgi:nitrite reductase/ring-hydroxylating ferredoxin subunit